MIPHWIPGTQDTAWQIENVQDMKAELKMETHCYVCLSHRSLPMIMGENLLIFPE